ncbi:hypothetical protein RvY_04792 [Ramazzottius varieornatus]|uniref:G-patch domain-containing protein n=1 Tax=Ramazzottius varieornatus TaxID=947166 RepID=A0A1D1USV1_RAMVA|nr:hypothetical protein RvY_04792 [Ramazzottius varieornatus]
MSYYNPYANANGFFGYQYNNGGYQYFNGQVFSNIHSSLPMATAELQNAPRPAVPPPPPGPAPPYARKYRPNVPPKNRVLHSIPTSPKEPSTSAGPIPRQKEQAAAYRVAPYSVSKPAQIYGEYSTQNKNWTRNKSDFNLLVVPPPEETAEDTSAVPVNIRALDGDIIAEPNSSGSGEIHSYMSTTSNRFGVSGPLSLNKVQNKDAHTGGIGKYLMGKMGWTGTGGIGARPGEVTPLGAVVEAKLDRKGLGVGSEPVGRAVNGAELSLPVAFLNDYCKEKQWTFPTYEQVEESGPPHCKSFLFKVKLNGMEYPAPEAANTKKLAKANAARACLKALGLVQTR